MYDPYPLSEALIAHLQLGHLTYATTPEAQHVRAKVFTQLTTCLAIPSSVSVCLGMTIVLVTQTQ